MYKYLFFLFFSFLSAQEPTLARLQNIYSNELQGFGIGNYNFYCQPYGVLTIDTLYKKSSLTSSCKKKIEQFYKQNKEELFFAQKVLHEGQLYHIELKKGQCILYAKGRDTYAEMLLAKGLAIREPNLQDRVWEKLFYKAQKEARFRQLGLWKDEIVKNCLGEIYK